MFDFENLKIYQYAKQLNKQVLQFLKENKSIDSFLKDQLKRASISIVLNVAEGSGRFTRPDKKNFYIISRGSAYECVALFEIIYEEKYIEKEKFNNFYIKLEEISKMLMGLINSCMK